MTVFCLCRLLEPVVAVVVVAVVVVVVVDVRDVEMSRHKVLLHQKLLPARHNVFFKGFMYSEV